MYLADEKGNPINKLYPLQIDATMSNGIPAEYISDTQAHTPGSGYVFCKIVFLTNSVISAYLPELTGNTFTGVTLTAGTQLEQELTSITLASGAAIAYKRLK